MAPRFRFRASLDGGRRWSGLCRRLQETLDFSMYASDLVCTHTAQIPYRSWEWISVRRPLQLDAPSITRSHLGIPTSGDLTHTIGPATFLNSRYENYLTCSAMGARRRR